MTLIRGVDTPVTVWHQDNTLQPDFSLGGFQPGSPEVSVFFLAPTSGRVLLVFGGQLRDSGGTQQAHIFARVELANAEFTGNDGGDSFNSLASSPPETLYMTGSYMRIESNLVPGREYRARVFVFVFDESGPFVATADFAVREIVVVPLP